MIVFVINKHGEALMPCSNRKARILLRDKRAKIVSYKPFTIQLLYGSTGYTQETNLGIDTGSKHIGFAITSQDKVLLKGVIELRDDVTTLLQTRKVMRRARRNKKRYRPARFLNRKRKEGWLPPSVQSKVNNTINWITKLSKLVPNCKINIEVGKFNIQKAINPNIEGKEYQQGNLAEYDNMKAFILYREQGKCQLCGKEYNGDKWNLHHIRQRKDGGSNSQSNLALLHEKCHKELHKKGLKLKKNKQYKDMSIMNIIRQRMFNAFPNSNFTYGCYTQRKRIELDLNKQHYNDAIVISGINKIKSNMDFITYIKQFRKKKRSLHEATARKGKKIKNIAQKRNSKNTKSSNGFFLNDCVKLFDKIGFVSGFTSGGCYVKDIFNNYITIVGKSYKQIGFSNLEKIYNNNNWQFISHLKERDFLPNKG